MHHHGSDVKLVFSSHSHVVASSSASSHTPTSSVVGRQGRAGGAIPVITGSWLMGIGHRHPVIVRRAVLRSVSMKCMWVLLHQTGAQYCAGACTRQCSS